jgi:hypothetical protein
MSSFQEIAETEHAESQARQRAFQAKREAALRTAKRAFDADVALLTGKILPLLMEAGEACSAVGAPPHVRDNFSIDMTLLGAPPAILEFWCAGPIRRSAKGPAMVEPKSATIELRSYRGVLTIGGDGYERAETIGDDPKPAMEAALAAVLRTYFIDLEASAPMAEVSG